MGTCMSLCTCMFGVVCMPWFLGVRICVCTCGCESVFVSACDCVRVPAWMFVGLCVCVCVRHACVRGFQCCVCVFVCVCGAPWNCDGDSSLLIPAAASLCSLITTRGALTRAEHDQTPSHVPHPASFWHRRKTIQLDRAQRTLLNTQIWMNAQIIVHTGRHVAQEVERVDW